MPFPVDDAHVGAERSPRRSRASVVPHGTRKVLMIADAFPPVSGSSVQRSVRFENYLPRFGWLATVWTANEAEGPPRDPMLCDKQPLEAAANPRISGSGILAMRRSLRGFVNARAGEGLTAVASRFAKAIDWRLEAWQSATSLPDEYIPWTRRSLGSLIKHVRLERFDVIYSTYNTSSSHRLALELKRRTNLPWVADFRDLGVDDRRYRAPSPPRRAVHRRLEQEILESADIVIAASERQRRILADQISSKYDKFISISDVFNSNDFTRGGDAETEDHSPFDGCGSEGPETCSRIELIRRLASVFDRLADRAMEAVETVHESLTTCQP